MHIVNAGETQQPRRGGPQQRKRKRVQDLSSDEEELEGMRRNWCLNIDNKEGGGIGNAHISLQ